MALWISSRTKGENVTITIDDHIESIKMKLSHYNVKDQKPFVACNYRAPEKLRKGNEDAYTPKVVSIGPIHHGRPHLQAAQPYKWKFLGRYLERSLLRLDVMVRETVNIEDEVRMSYLDNFDNISSQEFSEMIMLDFIFVIELLFETPSRYDSTIAVPAELWFDLRHDLLLFENQFPQQLLTYLYRKLYMEDNLGDIILKYFRKIGIKSLNASPMDWDSATDIVDFLVMCHDGKTKRIWNDKILKILNSATELQEAGVVFSKVDNAAFLLDVKFVNGKLEVPVIRVSGATKILFRNMLASEQSTRDRPKRLSGYILLMHNLIRSTKDVVLLKKCGIIENSLHDDEEVTHFFRSFTDNITIDLRGCYFCGVYKEMHTYSKNYWHRLKGSWFKWMRMLRRDYFSNPWNTISIAAAFLLLVLTAIQTTCAIIQTKSQPLL